MNQEKPLFSHLSHKSFGRYWSYFVWLNLIAAIAESTGAFILFIVLQAFFVDAGSGAEKTGIQALDTDAIGYLALFTLTYLAIFSIANYRRARRTIEEHLLPLLPPAFFITEHRSNCKETSKFVRFDERKNALKEIRKACGKMAWSTLASYAIWSLAIGAMFFSPDKDFIPLVKIVGYCFLVGCFMARLYYLRLSQADFIPLLSLEWENSDQEGLPTDEHHLNRQLAIINRNKLYSIRRSWLHEFSLAHVRWKVRIASRIIHRIGLLEARPELFTLPDNIAQKMNKSVGIREIQALWSGVVSILISAVFFFAVTFGAKAIGLLEDFSPWVVSITMGLLIVFLYVPSVLKFIVSTSSHNPDNRFERASAEAFGLITAQRSDNEFYSAEGKIDEKTGLLRYGIFYREVIHVLLRITKGMTKGSAEGSEWSSSHLAQDDIIKPLKEFSLILLDLDNFKIFNSVFGYLVADHLLFAVAQVITEAADENDGLAGRYGGEEFCIMLPEVGTDTAGALAEKIRNDVVRSIFVERTTDGSIRVVRKSADGTLFSYWSSGKEGYLDDLDPEIQYPNIERAKAEIAKYRVEERSVIAQYEQTGIKLHPSLESEKVSALGNLISGEPGVVWTTTVSVGVGGKIDVALVLGALRISAEDLGQVNYVKLFRRIFGRINGRVDVAKSRGRNTVVTPKITDAEVLSSSAD